MEMNSLESKEQGNMEGEKLEKTPEKNKTKVDFIRHSKATYATYDRTTMSDNPSQPFDHKDQIFPDLSPEGVELAKKSAKEFLKTLDPNKDELFFVSSNEVRALETAEIYHNEATMRRFSILKPEHSRSPISDKYLNGDIRMVNALSINFKNSIASNLLNPQSSRRQINFEALDPKEVETYKKLQEEIDKNNKGSFAANFLAYGDLVKKEIPEFETAEDLYNHNFKELIRLFKFAEKKAESSTSERQIRILAFSHENQLLVALNKYFDERGINNCEILHVESSDEGIKANFRGKESIIEGNAIQIDSVVMNKIKTEEKFIKYKTLECFNKLKSGIEAIKKLSEEDKKKINKAFNLAISLHINQKDRPSGEPYINHIMGVAGRVVVDYGVTSPEIIVSALLHDSVEDQAGELSKLNEDKSNSNKRESSFKYLHKNFGDRVKTIVNALSNEELPDGLDSETKNRLYKEHVTESIKDSEIALVKLANFSDNALTLEAVSDPIRRLKLSKKYLPVMEIFIDRIERAQDILSQEKITEIKNSLSSAIEEIKSFIENQENI